MKRILYAEDREDDVFFFLRACQRSGMEHALQVHVVTDGQMAVDYLTGAGEFADRLRHPMPDLVLLDLKMPRRSGLEVLEWIRSTTQFLNLPAFLLTSSNQSTDMQRAEALKANGYFIKPGGATELGQLVTQLAQAVGLKTVASSR